LRQSQSVLQRNTVVIRMEVVVEWIDKTLR
jgi:hypothetical protein